MVARIRSRSSTEGIIVEVVDLFFCVTCTNQYGIIDKPAVAKKFELVRLCSNCFEKEQDTPQTEVAKDAIWVQDGVAGKFGFVFPTKMTVVRLRSGALWVHSPLELTEKRKALIDSLGDVRYVICPNLQHHLFVNKWFNQYPSAKFYAAPGLTKKREDLKFDGTLGERPETGWGDEIDQFLVKGNPEFNEVVFYHKQHKTLIVSDLVTHYAEPFLGLSVGAMAYVKVSQIQNRLAAPAESFWRINKAAMRESVELVGEWPFERIIMCHGDVLQNNSRKALKEAYAHLQETD